MMVSLTKEGLVDGAKIAAASDISFDEYCELIVESLISGQSLGEGRVVLKSCGIDEYFSEETNQTIISGIHSEKKL